jgi:hypothetical protein
MTDQDVKIKPEDLMALDNYKPGEKELTTIGNVYTDYYRWRSFRSGMYLSFRGYAFDEYLTLSRELFWNSLNTSSTDLGGLGLQFSIPFARKETMDFLGRLTSLNIKPHIVGDSMDALGIKILQGIYKKWYFKSNEKVEGFWDLLYGVVNGTVCDYIGYNNTELNRRYLRGYDPKNGAYSIENKKEKYYNDVIKELIPIEDIYLPKIYERNIQKQGKMIWKTQMEESDFHTEFDKYPMAKYVFPGSRIAEDSLYFRLLGGTGTTTARKIELVREYDWQKDEYKITASGILLNRLGTADGKNFDIMPMPFDHKGAPFTWSVFGPLDAKLAYGLGIPFQSKDPHKILNTFYTMGVERELRAIDPVVLSSDIETPELIYGQHKTIQVGDVNAYKEFRPAEASSAYFSMMNSLQQNMTAVNNGGDAAAAPSKQPSSAREVMDDSREQQQALANTTILYYDMIRQQVLLVLKTALQFYTTEKYENSDKNAIRSILVSDMALTGGGIGNIKINIVKKHDKNPMEMFLEGIKQSIVNGKQTEVVNVPVEFLENLEFYIEKIELSPDNPTDIDLANFVENVIQPMIQTYVPAGLADLGKVMSRHVEKMGESMSDFVSDANLESIMSGKPIQPPAPAPTGQGGQANTGGTTGNLLQATNGVANGPNQSGPLTPKFGSRNNRPLLKK